MSSFFTKDDLWINTPHFISDTIEEMMYERQHSGVETTPDETSLLIEAFYKWVARIWIAEAIHAEQKYPNLFVDIFGMGLLRFFYDSVLSGRGGTIGAWVSIARTIRNFFRTKEIPTHTKDLLSLDFGQHPGDDSATAKLLTFRNEFAHGAFRAAKERVQKHYEILARCFEDIEGLYTQKIIAVESKKWFHCGQTIVEIEATMNLDDGIYMLGENENVMRLTGLYSFTENNLYPVEAEYFSSQDIFTSDRIQEFFSRYEKEKNGHIFCEDDFADTDIIIPEDIKQKICDSLEGESPLILIEGFPGTDAQNLLNHHEFFAQGQDRHFIWDVRKDDLTMSGETFAQKIMRIVEEMIDIQPQRKKSVIENINRYMEALQTEKKSLLVFINNLHIGFETYRREKYSVVDIYQILIDSPIAVVATVFPGQTRKGLFYDAVIPYTKTISNPEVLKDTVQEFAKDSIKKEILEAIGANSLHLFEICDSIDEKHQKAITFEPEIEYALWELSPILSTKRELRSVEEKQENLRIWSLFDHSILEYIQ